MFCIAPGKEFIAHILKQEECLEHTENAEGAPWLPHRSVGNVESNLLLHGMESRISCPTHFQSLQGSCILMKHLMTSGGERRMDFGYASLQKENL